MMVGADGDIARIYVGADRSQLLAVKVLEHSIARHTSMAVSVRSMHDLDLPEPKDIRQGKRTGFSFTRFAIPGLADRKGRALYLDADMLVFRDLREIFDLPFGGARVLIQDEIPDAAQAKKKNAPTRRIKQCSVMMLDCASLDWDVKAIVQGLDGRYSYEDLMFDLCILKPEHVGYSIPFQWNSLELYEPGRTGLLHYTDMGTQPWVCVDNQNGYLWLDEVRLMLANGALALEEIEQEVNLGYFRPSILAELADGPTGRAPEADEAAKLRQIDSKAGFEAHREVNEQRRVRVKAVKEYEARIGAQPATPLGALEAARAPLAALRRRLGF